MKKKKKRKAKGRTRPAEARLPPPEANEPMPERVVHPGDDQFIHRGWQVRNALQYHLSVLCTPGFAEKNYADARAFIDATWKALARRDVSTGKKIRLMLEVDTVAKGSLRGTDAGQAVVDSLPPELARPFSSLAARLGELVEAWRDRKGGDGKRVGKFRLCAEVWRVATGETTSQAALERFWKTRGPLHP